MSIITRYTLIIALFLQPFFINSAVAQPANQSTAVNIDSAVNQLLKNSDIKSLSIGIVKNKQIEIYYYGDIGNGLKPSGSNYFEIASITKTFTGFLLAQAIHDKKLNIDDDIRKYIKGNYSNLEFKGKPITFRHLTTHRSGLPYTFPNKPEIFVNPDYDKLPFIIDSLERNFTKNDFFQALAKVKLDTIPDSRFGYSNVGANLIAYILENVYKTTYERLLARFVFKAARMKYSKLTLNEKERKNLVQGYNPKRVKMPFYSPSIRAAGGLKSNLPDMMKYVLLQLNETNPIVNITHNALWQEENGNFCTGYFWQMDNNEGNKKIFQNGGSFGTSSWIEFYPKEQIGFFLITNVSGPNIHNQLSNLTTQIYHQITSDK